MTEDPQDYIDLCNALWESCREQAVENSRLAHAKYPDLEDLPKLIAAIQKASFFHGVCAMAYNMEMFDEMRLTQ
jgi:hypothetical protein